MATHPCVSQNVATREQIRLTLPADLKYLGVIGSCVSTMLADFSDAAYNVQLAINEACANVMEYAYAAQPVGPITIHLMLDGNGRCFSAEIRDTAPPFELACVPTPIEPDHWVQTPEGPDATRYTLQHAPLPDMLQERGRGLYLMWELMDEVSCLATPQGNCWRLQKTL